MNAMYIFDPILFVLFILLFLSCLLGLGFALYLLCDSIYYDTPLKRILNSLDSLFKRNKINYGLIFVCFIVFVFLLYKYFIKIL